MKFTVALMALATLAAAAPTTPAPKTYSLFRRDCPELPELADTAGCRIWSLAECELCCASNPGSSCHPGHDTNPCGAGQSQYHCEAH